MGVVTINMIRDGVMAALHSCFPAVKIYGEEIRQGFQEPCFFVKLIRGEQAQELGSRYRRIISFDIHFFAEQSQGKNRSMHDVAEVLYDILELINVDQQSYRGTGMRHEIMDGVLHFFVDYNFAVQKETEEVPLMEELIQEGGIKL